MRFRSRSLPWLLAGLVWQSLALAQPDCTAGDRACGRDAFARGTAAFDEARYAEAAAEFQRALAAVRHPVVAFNLALCHARLGRPTLAQAQLTRLSQEPELPAELAPRIAAELSSVRTAIAHVRLDTATPEAYRIELDGLPALSGARELELDPGEHRFRVTRDGAMVFDETVSLSAGERLQLRVTAPTRSINVVVVPEPASTPSKAAEPAGTAAPARRSGLPPAVFYGGAALTAVLGAVTIYSGVSVQRAYDRYEQDLPQLSREQAQARLDDGHRLELRTNLLLAATGVAAVSTALVTWLWVDFKSSPTTAVALSPHGIRIDARF